MTTVPQSNDAHISNTRAYYDEFSDQYEAHRDGRAPGGYHDLVDDLEVAFVARFGKGKSVLEVGCGTGLLLQRIARFASKTQGIDLSPGMLAKARARGLDVAEASATAIPFPDASVDIACSFKVLPHVRDIHLALSEMTRVVKPGGLVIAEFYNPFSFRGLAKRLGPAGAISSKTRENAVYTRFDSPFSAPKLMPPNMSLIASRGVRVVTPAAQLMRAPLLGSAFRFAERALCDSKLRYFGGFWIGAFQKN